MKGVALGLVLVPALLAPAGPRADDAVHGGDGSRRPNVLLLLPDQMRGQDMGCAGNPQVRTPHLDALAASGIYLPHTIANHPVCSPARATILTGLYAHRAGVKVNDQRLPLERVTLAERLAAVGYDTGFIGKWHLDGGPRTPGFVPPGPRRQGFRFWAAHECLHSPTKTAYYRDDDELVEAERFETEEWTELALEFLRAERDGPFLLVVAYGPPHDPYGAPRRFRELYPEAEVEPRPNWRESGRVDRTDLARYWAAISAVDESVGRILAELERSGAAQDTIVLFTSDHGDMLGSHGLTLKGKPYEESIRVPGILRYPGRLDAGTRSEVLFSHVDMAPTLLGLAGLEVPAELDGRDLSALLRGELAEAPGAVYLAHYMPDRSRGVPFPWRGIRTATSLFARGRKRAWLFFDLARDPYQLRNGAQDASQAEERGRLAALLAEAMQRAGDSWDEDIPQPLRLYEHPPEEHDALLRAAGSD